MGIGLTVAGITLVTQQSNNSHKVTVDEITVHHSDFNNGTDTLSWLTTDTKEVTINRGEDPTNRLMFGGLMIVSGIMISF